MEKPPVTRLRPLHSYQIFSSEGLEKPLPKAYDGFESNVPVIQRWSSFTPYLSEDICIRAFVKLVSYIICLDDGEAYCIQDGLRSGYLLARLGSVIQEDSIDEETKEDVNSFSYVEYDDHLDIPTDFSIGEGKALQLHFDLATRQLRLVAYTHMIPMAALEALGSMLDDIIVNLQKSRCDVENWSNPSILNFPARFKPVPLFSQQNVNSNNKHEESGSDEPALLHRWFEQRVAEDSDKIALDYLVRLDSGERIQYSYGQVDNAAMSVVTELVNLSSKSQPPLNPTSKTVAILIGPCPELYVSYLAALKAGFAFCPIPMDAPIERKQLLINDLKPAAILVAEATYPMLPNLLSVPEIPSINVTLHLVECDNRENDATSSSPSLVLTPSQSSASSSSSSLASTRIIAENDVAYIVYTSGTTGRPKGVAVSHLSVACTISALGAHYGFTAPGGTPVRWFQGAAPTFDISIFEVFWTLSTGSVLCCAPRDFTLQNPNRVITILGAEMTNVTPSFAALLEPSSIHGLMLGGESLNARVLQDFARYNPSTGGKVDKQMPTGVYNGYGPTETAIYCIGQAHVPEGQRGSVLGTPISTCGVLIVDERLQYEPQIGFKPLPMGAVGELVITGPQVSERGYINRPEETARVFIDDPQWGRSYRSGDRARIVWNSFDQPVVEFLGRITDDQVKLSGRRVELGEVENILTSDVKGLREMLCCVWKQQSSTIGSERIVSLVVLDKSANVDLESVQQSCQKVAQTRLPDYMRPFKMLRIDSIPRSTSGKADRKAASAYVYKTLSNTNGLQSDQNQETSTKNTEPLSDPRDAKLEDEILHVVCQMLTNGSESSQAVITANMPLVEIGIDSLHAMRLLRDLRKKLPDSRSTAEDSRYVQLQPSLAQLLDPNASIRSVFFPSARHSDDREGLARNRLVDFASRHMPEALNQLNLTNESDIEMLLPTTCTQSQLATSFALDKRNYISHSVLRLKPGISTAVLTNALRTTIDRQPIYRCVMLPCDDRLAPFSQVILTPDAWHELPSSREQLTHKMMAAEDSSTDTQVWLAAAEEKISLESHALYHFQIVENGSRFEPDFSSTGLLVISVAHCICDGASLEVLMDDIAREYADLEPIKRQNVYESVLDWTSHLSSAIDEYWQDSLRGLEAESLGTLSGANVQLSLDMSDCGHTMVQYTSDLQWQRLESKSRRLNASPLAILQSSWSLLLQLFSETDSGDITFGSVIAGDHSNTHAPTFSVLPCRVALPKAQTVSQLLKYLTSQSRYAQINRHTSFGIFDTLPYDTALALQAYAPPDLETDINSSEADVPVPWTDVETPAVRYDFAVFVEVLPMGARYSKQAEEPGNMTFKLTYREDTLSKISASCIAKQFAALIEIMLDSNPDDLVQRLPTLLPKDLLSVEGTPQAPEKPEHEQTKRSRSELLHHQFEEQTVLTPDRLALSFYTALDSSPVDLSYAELDARANGLAEILQNEDLEIVPICLQRSVELYVAVLAILKAGSAWCPIDETSPVQRRTSLIARTHSKVLLTTTESLHLVQPCLSHESLKSLRVLLVDEYITRKDSLVPKPRAGVSSPYGLCGQDLAYLLWTSGTTGEPKGVMIQHAAATQAMRDLQLQVKHNEADGQVRTLQLSSYSFDVFVQDLFYTWGLAGSVISGTRELVLGTFVEFIWKSGPTHAHLTPSFGASIAVNELRGSNLQYVTFIGEKLTEDVAEAWTAPGIMTCAYNTYGPAENAVVSTMRRFHGRGRDQAKAANVGFPLKPCTAYVVREVETQADDKPRWELIPRYGVGELALGGLQVAKGYLGNEAKTARAFIQGLSGVDERIYLTGDMVRLNDYGFEFLGRNDDLVKIAGIRIELSEISAACAAVKEEVASIEHVETLHLLRPGTEDTSESKIVVTFVSVKKPLVDSKKIQAQLFQKAKDLLPAYMVPGHIVVLETTMPRTASNKVDRKALKEIYDSSDLSTLSEEFTPRHLDQSNHECQAIWSEEQLRILEVIAESFKVTIQPLSPQDSLAGLGFTSLQVTKLAWTLRRELKCEVGVIDLMKCKFLSEVMDLVMAKLPNTDHARSKSSHAALPTASPANSWLVTIKEMLTSQLHGDLRPPDTLYILPATPIQESIVVETILEPGAYWSHRVFDLKRLGTVDTQRLEKAWLVAAERFDILRTIFVPLTQLDKVSTEEQDNIVTWARRHGIQSSILQLVRKEPRLFWTYLSLEENQDLASRAETLQLQLRPTTTMKPPWAVTIASGGSKMMLSMHHALYDNVSSEILLDTITKVYMEQAVDTSELTTQFERGMDLGLLPTISQRNEAVSKWNGRLIELRKKTGFLNAPFPDLTQSRQKLLEGIFTVSLGIPSIITESVSGMIAAPTLFQAAFGCVLASYLELKTVMFGQTVSQRILHPDLSRVMGPAIVTLPVIVRSDAASANELWSDLSRDSFEIFRSTQYLHPVDIKRMLNEDTGHSSTSFPALFVYHPTPEDDEIGQDTNRQHMFREVEQALSLNVEHPLALNIFETTNTIELSGNGRLISQEQLKLMLKQILDQARVMLESPEVPLLQLRQRMDLSVMSISRDNGADVCPLVNPTETVSCHASKNPQWIAVEEVTIQESDDREDSIITKNVTYAELDSITNAIVSRLSSHEIGLQPDDIVALYLNRDIISLAAILAIFRAGYVYLPLDEDLPPARKQLLVRDARPKLIITTERKYAELGLDPEGGPPTVMLPDGDSSINDILSCTQPWKQPGAHKGGYLLYTSGSTGQPKGVRVSSRSLCHFIASFSDRLVESSSATASLKGAGKYLNLTSRAFDPHLTQMFVPWYLGYRVVIGKDRNAMIGSLQQVINELHITHFGSVPSVLTQLKISPKDVPSVKVVTTGGEKASNDLLDTWSQHQGLVSQGGHDQQAVLFNFYGPTEVTIGCLGHAVDVNSNARNLGLPLKGLEAILLCSGTGTEHIIARRGEPGELCIAGPQVAMGYLNRPSENAKSFLTTALLGDGEKRMYRTGDMMRMMHDGTLEYLGRADQQVKIRGQRLELDEVVSFLKEASADEGGLDFAASTINIGDEDSDEKQQRLVAFIARKAANLLKGEVKAEAELLHNQTQALRSISEHLERKCEAGLPSFMVPTLLWISKIPYQAAAGKVDTKLLTKLASEFFTSQHQEREDCERSSSSIHKGQGPTMDAKESFVVSVVEEAVNYRVNALAASNVHHLGIDSLSAVHLVSILRKHGFSRLKLTDILSPSCTVGSIARSFHDDSSNDASVSHKAADSTADSSSDKLEEIHSISPEDLGPLPDGLNATQIEAVLPCLPLQAALVARSLLWSSSIDDKDMDTILSNVPYVAQFSYRLSKGTNISKWKTAVEKVVASEAMLRTCFIQREEDGQVLQVVLKSSPYAIFDDHLQPASIVAQINVRPPHSIIFDETEPGETTFRMMLHHALFDGIALDLFRHRVQEVYNEQQDIFVSPSKSLDLLTNIAHHCRPSDAQLESEKQSWRTDLNGIQPCRIDSISDDLRNDTMVRAIVPLSIKASELKDELRSLARISGVAVSISTVFQLATALCLAQLTQQASIVFGFITSLRPFLSHVVAEVDTFIGPCLNTLVQTIQIREGSETLPVLARRLHEAHLDACQGFMPFIDPQTIQRWADSEDRLFDALLNINMSPTQDLSEADSRPGAMIPSHTHSRSDMALAFDIDLNPAGGVSLTLSSSGVLTEPQLIEVGQLFNKIVCNSTKSQARVDDYVSLRLNTNGIMVERCDIAEVVQPRSHAAEEDGFQEAFVCVKNAICRILRLKSIEIDKDSATTLYRIGLDSITILPLVKLINKSQNIKLTPNAFIKARTIQGATKLVQDAKRTTSVVDHAVDIQDRYNNKPVTLSNDKTKTDSYEGVLNQLAEDMLFVATPLQEGMLSASLASISNAYYYTHTIQLSDYALQKDNAALDSFLAAVKDTVQTCEILRTRFTFTQSDETPWVGLVSATEQSDLVSWEVAKGSDQFGTIRLKIHHALYDAQSLRSIWRVLEENYRKRLHNQLSHNQQVPVYLFRPFARTVALAQTSSVKFWADLTRNYNYTPLNFAEDSLGASFSFQFTLEKQDLLLLQQRCSRLSVTIKAALQLAWIKTLCESVYGQSDMVYGDVVSTGAGTDGDNEGDDVVVGPAINTVPMRVKLAESMTIISVAEALAQIQQLSDDARGTNSMASLRKIQMSWRSSHSGQKDDPGSLFQGLFSFDGNFDTADIGDREDTLPLFRPIPTKNKDSEQVSDDAPVYDDYPIIASFHIKNDKLSGKLRTKLANDETKSLGSRLQDAVRHIISCDLETPACDISLVQAKAKQISISPKSSTVSELDNAEEDHSQTANAVKEIVKSIIGGRYRGKEIGYNTRLINIGVDSILAIRLSKLLKNQLGMNVSIFNIMKGASIHEIITSAASNQKIAQQSSPFKSINEDHKLKSAVSRRLGTAENTIQCVLPVLAGQRAHLEQWLFNGKRFFEAPWVYRVVTDSLDAQAVAEGWSKLCKIHDILRTTFVYTQTTKDLVQVTFNEQWNSRTNFTVLRDFSNLIQPLIQQFVETGNNKPSDFKQPPASCSFLEASDGKAIVLRIHHALYDAWSIKMIVKDLDDLLASGNILRDRPSMKETIRQIEGTRQPDAEDSYWSKYLSGAQDTILQPCMTSITSPSAVKKSSLGPHFKMAFSNITSKNANDAVSHDNGNTFLSPGTIFAYARTLKHFTNQSRPTFGFNYASRSLSSVDEAQSLDLTSASVPTLTLTPMCVDLEEKHSEGSHEKHVVDQVQAHLAYLSKFARSNNLERFSPKYNCYLNIVHAKDDNKATELPNKEADRGEVMKILSRFRLNNALAKDYFTVAKPLVTTDSTIEELDTSHLCAHPLFCNVIFRPDRMIDVTVTGDEALLGEAGDQITRFVSYFGSELKGILARACTEQLEEEENHDQHQ